MGDIHLLGSNWHIIWLCIMFMVKFAPIVLSIHIFFTLKLHLMQKFLNYYHHVKISWFLSPCEKARLLSPFENISIIITMLKYLDYHHLGKISRLFSPCENVFIIITMWKYIHYYHHVKISWLSSPCENVFILNQIESLSSHFPRFPRGWSGGLKLGN